MGKETFFTEADKLQEQGQNDAFGPINSSEFRTSSRHRCSEKATAFAVADGHLVAVRQRPGDASSPLNLVLIPHGMKHPEVRCFVYINVDCESYFTQDGNFLNTEAQAHNDLIPRIIKAHGENASAYTVLCTDNNADYDITDTERLMLSLSGNQPWPVREGDKIGQFNAGEIGFETVLKSMDFPFTLTDAKAANPAIAKDGDNDKEAERRSLMFEDPAVLFPKHKDKFAYGNYVYLDIRIADGLPYYHAYQPPEIITIESGADGNVYDNNGWPIVRCRLHDNGKTANVKIPNRLIKKVAIAIIGADFIDKEGRKKAIEWNTNNKIADDSAYTPINIVTQVPKVVRIKLLPQTDKNAPTGFHKNKLDMVFGDYIKNIEKIKVDVKNSDSNITSIVERETYINHNDEYALLKTSTIIERCNLNGNYTRNRIYWATIEEIGKYGKIVKQPLDVHAQLFINHTKDEGFFEKYNRAFSDGIVAKSIDGLLTYIYLKNRQCSDFFLCMTEQEAEEFDNEWNDQTYITTAFELTKEKEGDNITYRIRQILRTIDGMYVKGTLSKDVYCTSGEAIFATKEYLKNVKIDILSLPEVHFRRKSNEIYDFGFDWMRDGMFDKSTSEKPYIKKDGSNFICKSNLITLKNNYEHFTINGHTYYIPWLNIMSNGKEAKLKIKTFNINKENQNTNITISVPPSIWIKIGDEIYGNDTNTIEKDINLSCLMNVDYITIICTKSSEENRAVRFLINSQTEIGHLNIYKNKKTIKNIKIKFYNVVFHGSTVINKDIYIKANGHEFQTKNAILSTDGSNNLIINANGNTYKIKNHTQEWEEFVKSDSTISITKKLHSQNLVENIDFNQPQNLCQINLKDAAIQNFIKNINGFNTENEEAHIDIDPHELINIIGEHGIFQDTICIYLFPFMFINKHNINIHMYSDSANSTIIACGTPNNNDNSTKYTIAHEIGHCLGLKHTFRLKTEKTNEHDVFFEKYKTENVMDYSDVETSYKTRNKKSFWKWQWDVILTKSNK